MEKLTTRDLNGIFYINLDGDVKQVKIDFIRMTGARTFIMGVRTPSGTVYLADTEVSFHNSNYSTLVWYNHVLKSCRKVLYRTKEDAILFNNCVDTLDMLDALEPAYKDCESVISKMFEVNKGIIGVWSVQSGIRYHEVCGNVEIRFVEGGYKANVYICNRIIPDGLSTDIISAAKILKSKGYFLTESEVTKHLLSTTECECFEDEKQCDNIRSSESMKKNLHRLIDEADGATLICVAGILLS